MGEQSPSRVAEANVVRLKAPWEEGETMPRIRTVKPEFWGHTVLGKMGDSIRLLALALLNLADDEGYFYADPITVRNFARPFDESSSNTTGILQELSRIGWIEVREHPEQGPVGLVVNFLKHQVISHPKPSTIRHYYDSSNSPVIVHEHYCQERNGKEWKGMDAGTPSARGRRTRKQIIEGFPPEVREVVNTLLDEWPEADPEDNRKIVCSAEDFGQRVSEIMEANPNVTAPVLLQAGRDYINSGRKRFKAPQYFFGPGKQGETAPWLGFVRAVL